ncbi:Inositol monophosphatase 2 [Balamuthia mandrillaris]
MGDKQGLLQRCFEVAMEAAEEAAAIVRGKFGAHESVQEKGGAVDLVTEVDVAVERLIVAKLSAAFPDHLFLGEESTAASQEEGAAKEEPKLTSQPTWVIDPIDGTTNFVHSYPFVAICIGLAIGRRAELGIVYNPILNEKFTAIRGQGAFLNNKPIHVSQETQLSRACIATNIGYSRSERGISFMLDNLQSLLKHHARGIRCCGSAASGICDVACGRSNAYYEWGVHSWDMCAASVIVEEAGGVVVTPSLLEKGGEGELFDLDARSILCGKKEVVMAIAPLLNKEWSENM